MSDCDVSQIKDRLTKIEVQVVEKWSSHDKRSDERWADLMEKFHEMAKKLDNRPCDDHIKVMADFHGRVKNLEGWVDKAGWAIGVIYAAVAGAAVTMLFKHLSV